MRQSIDSARIDLHEGLAGIRRTMETVSSQFVAATGAFVSSWFKPRVNRILSENPGTFAALSETTRSAMKQQVLSLMADAPDQALQLFEVSDVWWHLKNPSEPRGHYNYVMQQGQLPTAIDEIVRFCMGSLLPVVEAHGFNASGFTFRQPAKDMRGQRKLPSFRRDYTCDADMQAAISDYAELHARATQFERRLVELDREEARDRDLELWDQA